MRAMKRTLIAAMGVGALAVSQLAAAAFPERPITLVVPYAPGGITDNFGRAIADGMSRALKQPVVVENKPGASAMIGTAQVARAPADGYTILLGSHGTLTLNPLLRSKIAYDAEKDFAVFAMAGEVPTVLLARPDAPFNNLKEFEQHAKQNPGKLNYASVGACNVMHIVTVKLMADMGIDMTHVPYKGSSPAHMGMLGNEAQFMTDVVPSSYTLVQAGRLKPLAVASDKRLAALPDVPTFEEAGYGKFHASSWIGVAAPAGTPADVLATLQAAANKAIADPKLRQTFINLGMEMTDPMNNEQIQTFLTEDRNYWKQLVQEHKIPMVD